MGTTREIKILPDLKALAEIAAERLIACTHKGASVIGICLTGGSDPKGLYELLAEPAYRDRISWPRVHWFIGDDRFVPQGDRLSNIGAACSIFLNACAPPENVHAIDTTAETPDAAAQAYERELRAFQKLREDRTLFDLVLMGVGPDGHTASLFPGAWALEQNEKWVVGISEANVEPFVPRVSLTLAALGLTKTMMFLVSGSNKRSILAQVFDGNSLPASRANAFGGETIWLIDEAAAP